MFDELKSIPNQLTLLRLVIIPVMYFLALNGYKQIFIILFILAGVTDVLDGFLARRLEKKSSFGNNFDSVADRIFYISLTPWFFLFEKEFLSTKLLDLVIFAVLIIIFQLINFYLNKKFIFRHTYLAKFSAVMTYLLLLLALFIKLNNAILYTILSLAVISSIEEIMLNVKTILK